MQFKLTTFVSNRCNRICNEHNQITEEDWLVKDMQVHTYEQSNRLFMHNWNLCSMSRADDFATSARKWGKIGEGYLKANLVREEVWRSKGDSLMFMAEKNQEKLKRNGWYQGHTLKILMGLTLSS